MLKSLIDVFSFAKKNWKPLLIIFTVLFVIFSIKSCNKKNQEIRDLKALTHFNDSSYSSQIKNWKDKYGEEHEQVENLTADHLDLVEQFDSLSNLLGIKGKQIESFSKTALKISVHGGLQVDTIYKEVATPKTDSISIASAYEFNWKDTWMQVHGSIGDSGNVIDVSGIDTLSRVDYWKRKWFLGAKHYYTDYTNSNKHITVVGYKGIRQGQKEKKWNISLSATYGYPVNYIQLNKPVWTVGISAGYSLFSF